MTPNDPRHGTSAGYCAGCRDLCCRVAIADYSRDLRTRQYLAGGPLRINAIGTKRRVQALIALGWPTRVIDAELGRKRTYTANMLCGPERVLRSTAQRYAAVYERLSMRFPDERVRPQVASRMRNLADRNNWPPPLAWDDIDDPDEQPTGWHYIPADRADSLTDLIERGAGISEACRVLNLRRDSLERWCERNGRTDLFQQLTRREHGADRWGQFGGAA